MARVNKAVPSRNRRKKILALAKGFRGRRKNCFRIAKQAVEKSLQYAYRDRKKRKAQMRALWIQRINAAVREHNLTYSTFMHLLKKHNIEMNRKTLADIAVRQPEVFTSIIKRVV
ncbi:MAG: 50S ribosomal protein L20 [Alphaproteobacteria bacterium]|nr:50S ribosomal protein L20 [Alphaproteobacteria bacterium]